MDLLGEGRRNSAPPGEDLTTFSDAPTIQTEANAFREDLGNRVHIAVCEAKDIGDSRTYVKLYDISDAIRCEDS
uniref:Protein kinase domain-containing protein n=1 Tax=Steinernema glaseri TaxID=37863 RepID=A0A1I7ZVK4_9BILA